MYNHEEADKYIVLYFQFAGDSCSIHSDGTDAFFLLLAHRRYTGKCYSKQEKGTKTRIIELSSCLVLGESDPTNTVKHCGLLIPECSTERIKIC